NEQAACSFLRDLAHFRRHHFARAAPWRPKIYQHRYCRMACERVKSEIILNIDRFINRLEFRLALAASENFAQTFVSHAVSAPAFWAVYQDPVLIEFIHSNKITHPGSPRGWVDNLG